MTAGPADEPDPWVRLALIRDQLDRLRQEADDLTALRDDTVEEIRSTSGSITAAAETSGVSDSYFGPRRVAARRAQRGHTP